MVSSSSEGPPVGPASQPDLPPPPPPPPAGPPGRRRDRGSRVALALLVLGIAGMPVFFVLAVLTANPCGGFGDHCTNYGKTDPVAVVFMLAAALAAIAAITGGVVLLVNSVLSVLAARRRTGAGPAGRG